MRDHITLLLNGQQLEIRNIEPATTVLQWLRTSRRLTGSKEGCAEGDCGACTIVVGRLRNGVVRYHAVNACIAFLPMLEGASIVTVEGVSGPGGALHPVQQAMVACHGSQCGFCTPGFVMSMYALYLNHDAVPSRAEINAWLAGNLCRCTGYGPIAAAAVGMFELPRPDWDVARRAADQAALLTLEHRDTLDVNGASSRLLSPGTFAALTDACLANPMATLVSGATDVGLWVTKRGQQLPVIITTGRVRDQGFADTIKMGRDVWIGAGVTHADAAHGVAVPALTGLWRRFAGLQVRNTGTVGGNIANGSPIGDLAPAFIALGATLHLQRGSVRRTLPLDGYFISYGRQDRAAGEFVHGVGLKLPEQATDFAVHKVSKRFDDDISAVCGAFNIRVADGKVAEARIAFGGMAATPKRAVAVEAALTGQPWTQATIDAASAEFASDFQPVSDLRASSAYRLTVAQNLLQRVYLERTAQGTATCLTGPRAEFGA